MRANLMISASIENSRDFKRILEAKRCAAALYDFARDYKNSKFDVADRPQEGKFTLTVKWDSEEAEKHAKRLIRLAEGMEKEAREFYKSIGISICGEKLAESPVMNAGTPRHVI